MQGMSHDSTFPDSAEAPDKRTERAIEALQIENEAGLGFRRRERSAMGNPYAEPERFQVDREPTAGELWAGLLAGLGVVLAVGAIFYKPILFGALAVFFTTLGSLGDGQAAKVARWGFVLSLVGTFIGMVMVIFVTNKAIW
jgi:hypothetical protein